MAKDGPTLTFVDLRPPPENFLQDVLRGLGAPRKFIPPKYFYDARGCVLFEKICALPEYYLTRTELALMRERAAEMAAELGEDCALIEIGCGNSEKTRLLLGALRPPAFIALDIAWEQLELSCDALSREFPGMRVVAVRADFSLPLELPDAVFQRARRRAMYFPGSTVGNFTPPEALEFLRGAARLLGPGGAVLVGVDLRKAKAMLDAAYDDAQGVTAEFNLNLLSRINRELGADFDLSRFRHQAFYDPVLGRIEMHLASAARQTVTIAGRHFEFGAGETIHTENSYKYSVEAFQALAVRAGLRPARVWTDTQTLFAVHALAV